ncbi:MAG: 4Fe-4S binding protein [Spirochaetaceae bacterium]|nr:4Fe-4S binding protein [Spirochaetaceae bacterium]
MYEAKMKRDIILINEDLCTGCGFCASSCHEGALTIIDGKARLIGDLLCDGLGACLAACPTYALTIERREAEPYNEAKVMATLVTKGEAVIKAHLLHLLDHKQTQFYNEGIQYLKDNGLAIPAGFTEKIVAVPQVSQLQSAETSVSHLKQWPIQLHLVSPLAPHFKGSHLLLAADCVPFAYPNFHSKFLADKTLAIACPKLDDSEGYLEKLVAFINEAGVTAITVLTMEVPCCGGLWYLAQEAVTAAGLKVELKRKIINLDGTLRE